MDDMQPVGGLDIGPPQERLTYATVVDMRAELHQFWVMIEWLFMSFPGQYDDAPDWCRESGTDALKQND